MKRVSLAALLSLFLIGRVFAQQLSPDEIVKRLDPATAVTAKPGLRASPWSNTPGNRGAGEEEATALPSVSLSVPFDYNSDKLTPDGIISLRGLAAALKDPKLSNYRFKIAGHTDAKGTPEYNQKLSERRAQAVRDYLVFQYDMEPTRLDTVGYGRTQLADPTRPEDGVNRRVQVLNVGTK
jgi:outer membrane protein OmpA-like peptidoglycan-associated protein